jgi:bifunctional non-homologous end joining protein LigD
MRIHHSPPTAVGRGRAKAPGAPLIAPIGAGDLTLLTLHKRPFNDRAWLFEFKYDGYRCLVRKAGDAVELISRHGKPLNQSFPDIVQAVAAVPGDFTWDAELVVDDDSGISSFDRLQTRARTKLPYRVREAAALHPARLYVFDMLSTGERDLRALALSKRKDFLRDAFDDTKTLVCASGVVGAGEWVFDQVKGHGFEGMVAKRLASPYQAGRTLDWQKIKFAGYKRLAALGWGRNQRSSQS